MLRGAQVMCWPSLLALHAGRPGGGWACGGVVAVKVKDPKSGNVVKEQRRQRARKQQRGERREEGEKWGKQGGEARRGEERRCARSSECWGQ